MELNKKETASSPQEPSVSKRKIITSDDILGKDVVDSAGDIIGVVQKIHIDKNTKNITGITLDEGFMKPDLFVGIEFIKTFGIDSIFLNIRPAQKVVGLKVFDNKGKALGKVISVDLDKSKVKALHVRSNLKTEVIPAQNIAKIVGNVFLK